MFMPFIKETELENLQNKVEYLEEELHRLKPYASFLELAKSISEETVRLIREKYTGNPDEFHPESVHYDFDEIGQIAYENVLNNEVEKAKRELAADYESKHRKDLYDKVLNEIAESEGMDISEEVRVKIETDPTLAVELRDSARKEIGARALGQVHAEITKEQEAIVEAEADRQVALDRLDVLFAHDGELDLSSEKVKALVKPGDKLVLLSGNPKKAHKLVFVWSKDANDAEGWISSKDNSEKLSGHKPTGSSAHYELSLITDRFTTIASENKDLQTGEDVLQVNELVAGLPIVLIPSFVGRPSQKHNIRPHIPTKYDDYYGGYGSQRVLQADPFTLTGIDFQTKDLVFTNTDYK